MDQIRVGSFVLYPSERQLCGDRGAVDIGARAFDLLLVLAENAGRLVTKATLLERVWPRLVVDENNLPTQVAALRRILGSEAIKTVPGFGYRLELSAAAGDLTAAAAPVAPVTAAPAPPTERAPRRRSWPDRLVPLIGRETDLHDVGQAITRACIVTIVGAAGVGKTRLAQELLAHEVHAGRTAVWVPLGSIDALQHVPSAIALAAGLSLPDGPDPFLALRHTLEDASLLLLLDGAEHLAAGLAGPLAALVTHAGSVRVVVTSQSPLGVSGETVYRLGALPVPGEHAAAGTAADSPAVALFAQRATAADRSFALDASNAAQVAAVCRHLDGNPLALELAAARLPALGLSALLARLDDRFRLLRHGNAAGAPRHGALQAAFDWSYRLLSAAEQRVFNRLGAFAGSFSLEIAARCVSDVTGDVAEAIDLIGRLVDRSLVTALPGATPRYTLPETGRYYALEQLRAVGDTDVARGQMSTTMLGLLDAAYVDYWSLDEARWLARYAPELDNVRGAIDWAILNDRNLGVALYGSAWPLFAEAELYAEARSLFDRTVPLIDGTQPRARLGRFWEAVATFDSNRQCDRARYAAELAAAMHFEAGDMQSRYHSLMLLALNWRGDDDAARAAFAAAQALEDPGWPARLLTHGALTEGALLMSASQFEEARIAFRRAVRLALTISDRQALAATVNIVELDLACGDTVAALQLGRPLSASMSHQGRRAARLDLLAVMFSALLLAGEREQARSAGAELFELATRLDPGKLYLVIDAMAYLACEERRYEVAARVALAADAARAAHGQARRRPTEDGMRRAVRDVLDAQLGADWSSLRQARPLGEAAASALALGFEA